jgi:hypothetical protein
MQHGEAVRMSDLLCFLHDWFHWRRQFPNPSLTHAPNPPTSP